jgi:hypothetical protein
VGVYERFQIRSGHPEFAANPDCPQLTPMNPGVDRRFVDLEKLGDLMGGHERLTQHRCVRLNTK